MQHRTITSLGAVALLFAGLGLAQPEAAPERRGREIVAERLDDPAALRTRLERTIERSEAMLERHREAIARLDAGESPAEVMRSLRMREQSVPGERPDRGADTQPGSPGGMERPGPGRGPTPDAGPGAEGPEAKRRLRVFLREHLPSVHEQLAQIEAQDTEMGDRLFERLMPQLREVAMEMDRDPAFGALKLTEMRAGLGVVDATQRLRSLGSDASNDQRGKAESELREAISARFDARMKLREHELERLARRITDLHDQIKEEMSGRDAEIERVYQSVLAQRWSRPNDRGPERRPGRP